MKLGRSSLLFRLSSRLGPGGLCLLVPLLLLLVKCAVAADPSTTAKPNDKAQERERSLLDPDPNPNYAYENNNLKEFQEFCEFQEKNRNTPEELTQDECKKIDAREFHEHDLHMLFMVFLVLLYGAVVRSILKHFQVSLPYSVVIMASGMVIGMAAKYNCYDMYTYTAIARLNSKIYLFVFLPVLLFESSFSMSGHIFVKAAGQVLLLACPGMLFCTVLTAFVCKIFFANYHWSLLQCVFFGCIISATDPVAVVAILKDLGVSETLGILVDGESLLNDGVAILLYEVFQGLLINAEEQKPFSEIAVHTLNDFLRIAIGGPIFGWVMAKFAIFALSRVFNDAVVEITITLVATYMTYYIGEAVLGVSGVMAVVLLGLTMSSEKTCISPETEHEVHEFWEMLGHLANTVLFFITGVIITERGTRQLDWDDLYYLILLYCALNLIRFFMLLTLSPVLTRIGYGMPWQNMIVMMWGGLRGAVGICLSLEVYEDTHFCTNQLGPKILIHTAGIVFLTLIINGTTTKKLLELLKLTEISQGRMEEMKNAVKTIHVAQKRGLLMLRHDRFLADANWTYVAENTKIDDPYKHKHVKRQKKQKPTSILSLGPEHILNECPECHAFVPNQPTNEELRSLTEEARLRVIKAMKISYWAHFERGVLTEEAVQTLAGVADSCTDRPLYMIHTKDFKKYLQIRGIFPWIREKMVIQIGEKQNEKERLAATPPPANKWRCYLWYIATRKWFDYLVTFIVLLHVIPSVWQLVLENHFDQCALNGWMPKLKRIFRIANYVFTSLYFTEFLIKIIGLGCASFWKSKWNWVDFIALFFSVLNGGISFIDHCGENGAVWRNISKLVKIARCIRFTKLIRPLLPMILDFVNGKINTQLFLGYDVALGFIVGCDDVMKYLPQMIDNKKVYTKIRAQIERERMEAVREMGILQKDHPGIAIAIKTRHASRSVLNQMKSMLVELRTDGLLDEKENDLLTIVLEERMKHLWTLPNYITPPAPEALLENLIWLYGHNELRDFIFENATLLQYEVSDVIIGIGDLPQGVFVIISGMVKIRYEPNPEVKEQQQQFGVIPAMEVFKDFDFDKTSEDFYSSGTVIGESSCLTGRVRAASVICETEGVTAYHVPLSAMKKALSSFTDKYNSLEERLWRACGLRRCSGFLVSQPSYHNFTKERLDALLERSCCPIGPEFQTIRIPSYVHDVVVFEGWVEDVQNGDVYIAPSIIPKSCSVFRMKDNPKTCNRVLVILAEDQGPDENESDDLSQCIFAAKKLRRPSLPHDEQESHAPDGEKGNPHSQKEKQKRHSISVNFGVRQKSRRHSLAHGYEPDDKRVPRSNTEGDGPVEGSGSTKTTHLHPPPPK